jgi:hypothetical protein
MGVVTVTPDTKDWTWVLDRPCTECGFDTREPARDRLGEVARANGEAWMAFLAATPAPDRRPDASTWSALEYACHVRDVYRLGELRLSLMVDRPGVVFDDWDQDAAALDGDYLAQAPRLVAIGIGTAAARVANRLDAVEGGIWSHAGRRSNGSLFTVESFARYLVHDPVHHLWDVTGRPRAA